MALQLVPDLVQGQFPDSGGIRDGGVRGAQVDPSWRQAGGRNRPPLSSRGNNSGEV